MNKGYSSRGRTIASGIAAAAVTAVLLSSLVESFNPADLQKLEEKSAPEQVAAVDKRRRALGQGHPPPCLNAWPSSSPGSAWGNCRPASQRRVRAGDGGSAAAARRRIGIRSISSCSAAQTKLR